MPNLDLSNPHVLKNFSSHIEMYHPRQVSYQITIFDLFGALFKYYWQRFPKRKVRRFVRKHVR